MNKKYIEEKTFDEILLERGIIKEEHLKQIEQYQKVDNVSYQVVLTEMEVATEYEIVQALYEYVEEFYIGVLDKIPLDNREEIKRFFSNFYEEKSKECNAVIFEKDEEKKLLKIRCSDITNLSNLDDIKEGYKDTEWKNIEFYATSHMQVSLMQKRLYSDNSNIENYLIEHSFKKEFADNIQEWTDKLIEYAILENRSDIYIQYNKTRRTSKIYFRINRDKKFILMLKTEQMNAVLNSIKTRANMGTGQIGHEDGNMIRKILDGRYQVNIRRNSISTIIGSQLTLRLQRGDIERLSNMGFQNKDLKVAQSILQAEEGIVVLSGETGSGKSTTLRAMIREFDIQGKNIITMEDPVEVVMEGVNHIAISDDKGQSFKDSIRACMRQRPDILLIGEIRDQETAERRVERATTGHLVFTTIHRNSIEGIKDRLKELGVQNTETFTSNISLAIHQELVKKDNKLKLEYEMYDWNSKKTIIRKL